MIDKLLETLRLMNAKDLDDLLDLRDQDPFDCAWVALSQRLCDVQANIDSKALFLNLSTVTQGHEVCSYIVDDFELIAKTEVQAVESEFLSYLKSAYAQGKVPSQ